MWATGFMRIEVAVWSGFGQVTDSNTGSRNPIRQLVTLEILWNKSGNKNPVRQKVGEGDGTPFQYSCLENPMDGVAWWATVHGVAKSRIRLSDFTLTFHFPALEKEMATHSSVLAWRIPGTGEPDGLPSKGSHRVGHDWSDLAAAAAETISGTKRISTFSNGWMVKLNPRT